MKLDRKNVRIILLIITFAVVLYTVAQNLAAIYGAVATVWNVFGVVITGLAMAFVLNVPLKLFENRVFYGMSEDRRPYVRKMRRSGLAGLRAGRDPGRHRHPHRRHIAPAHRHGGGGSPPSCRTI